MAEKTKLFDSVRIGRFRARAQKHAGDYDFLRRRAWTDIRARRDAITRAFTQSLLISPFALPAEDVPAGMAWAPALPDLAPDSLDLIVSLLHLHTENDLPAQLQAMRRALHPDGVLLAAVFGERTLHELRHLLLEAESAITGGAQARIIPFARIKALGDLLQGAGFALPVADVDRVKVHYRTLSDLLHDVRGMGESNPLAGPVRPLRRDVLNRADALYRARHGDGKGRLPASFEIVHLCGWAPDASQPKPLSPGSAEVSLTDVFDKGRSKRP